MSDLRAAHKRIEQLVRASAPVRAGVFELIALCEEMAPSPIWARFRELDWQSDQQGLTQWLKNLLEDEPPPSTINGFWFGLFNPYLDDGKPTCRLYLAGSERFDPSMGDPDWPCHPAYFPEGRYSPSDVLTVIYRDSEAAGGRVVPIAEYALGLGYSALVIADWCKGSLRQELLGSATSRGVVAGFDDGDFLLIDVLRAERSM